MTRAGEHFRRLERMYASAPVNRFFEPTLTVSEGRAELVIPVRPDFFHAAHAVHGAVYFKAIDDAAYFAASSLVTDVFIVTVTFNVLFARPISSGAMVARASVVHRSRNLLVAEGVLTDEEGRQIGRGSGSFTRSKTPLSPEVGYA